MIVSFRIVAAVMSVVAIGELAFWAALWAAALASADGDEVAESRLGSKLFSHSWRMAVAVFWLVAVFVRVFGGW